MGRCRGRGSVARRGARHRNSGASGPVPPRPDDTRRRRRRQSPRGPCAGPGPLARRRCPVTSKRAGLGPHHRCVPHRRDRGCVLGGTAGHVERWLRLDTPPSHRIADCRPAHTLTVPARRPRARAVKIQRRDDPAIGRRGRTVSRANAMRVAAEGTDRQLRPPHRGDAPGHKHRRTPRPARSPSRRPRGRTTQSGARGRDARRRTHAVARPRTCALGQAGDRRLGCVGSTVPVPTPTGKSLADTPGRSHERAHDSLGFALGREPCESIVRGLDLWGSDSDNLARRWAWLAAWGLATGPRPPARRHPPRPPRSLRGSDGVRRSVDRRMDLRAGR